MGDGMTIDASDFTNALLAAGIPIAGADGTGRIHFLDSATDQQRAQAAQILATWNQAALDAIKAQHTADQDNDLSSLYNAVQNALQAIANEQTQLASVPNPITSLAQANTVLQGLVTLLNVMLAREAAEIKALARLVERLRGQ
jgi:hypothetical protein